MESIAQHCRKSCYWFFYEFPIFICFIFDINHTAVISQKIQDTDTHTQIFSKSHWKECIQKAVEKDEWREQKPQWTLENFAALQKIHKTSAWSDWGRLWAWQLSCLCCWVSLHRERLARGRGSWANNKMAHFKATDPQGEAQELSMKIYHAKQLRNFSFYFVQTWRPVAIFLFHFLCLLCLCVAPVSLAPLWGCACGLCLLLPRPSACHAFFGMEVA